MNLYIVLCNYSGLWITRGLCELVIRWCW